jgi:hypothetical protein
MVTKGLIALAPEIDYDVMAMGLPPVMSVGFPSNFIKMWASLEDYLRIFYFLFNYLNK